MSLSLVKRKMSYAEEGELFINTVVINLDTYEHILNIRVSGNKKEQNAQKPDTSSLEIALTLSVASISKPLMEFSFSFSESVLSVCVPRSLVRGRLKESVCVHDSDNIVSSSGKARRKVVFCDCIPEEAAGCESLPLPSNGNVFCP